MTLSADEVARLRAQLGITPDKLNEIRAELDDRPDQRVSVRRHGTRRGYRVGCRCNDCREAQVRGLRELRARRMARRQLVDGFLVAVDARTHGTVNTYREWGCRCRPCRQANARDQARYRAKRSFR